MSEEFILSYVPQKVKELGYSKHHLRFRDLLLNSNSERTIYAYNSLFILVGDPYGIMIESAYGKYDTWENEVEDNIHIHRGAITIVNPDIEKQRVKFIEVILIN